MSEPDLKELTKVIYDEILSWGKGGNFIEPAFGNKPGDFITVDCIISAEDIARKVIEYLEN